MPWDIDSTRVHLEDKIAANDLRYQERYEAQEKALLVALEQAATLATHTYREMLDTRLGEITKVLHKADGDAEANERHYKEKINRIMVFAFMGSGLFAVVLTFLLNHFIK